MWVDLILSIYSQSMVHLKSTLVAHYFNRLWAPGWQSFMSSHFIPTHLWFCHSICTQALWWWQQLVRLWALNQKGHGYEGSEDTCWRKSHPQNPYQLINNTPTLSDGKTKVTEEEVEGRGTCIIDYKNHKCLAQHIILSMMSTWIGAMIKNLCTTHEM